MSFKKSTSFHAKTNHSSASSDFFYQATISSFRRLWCVIFSLSSLSFALFLYWCHAFGPAFSVHQKTGSDQPINLLTLHSAWNHLDFPAEPPAKRLKIALFVKRWPDKSRVGGLERHALTLHTRLAARGHELHVFTTGNGSDIPAGDNLFFHLSKPSPGGYLDQASVWRQFLAENSSSGTGKEARPFDVVHSESVGLLHTRSRHVAKLAVSWHGIAYETIHSDIIQELLRRPEEDPQSSAALTGRISKVVEEVKFFQDYSHHVATSDHAGDVLRRIYMIPDDRVHVILNGVDENTFRPDPAGARRFKASLRVPDSKTLIVGMAGRLVKDKGHPLMFEALRELFVEDEAFRQGALVLVAGDGPWASRYRGLGPNLLVLGPLEQAELAQFYNAIDVFVNPTLRAQGLDHTLLEAVLCGKPVMATRVASVAGSVIFGESGYTFSPTVESLKRALSAVFAGGREALEAKGLEARRRGFNVFTATKMAAAYERLFLCISEASPEYCHYPTSSP